MSHTGEGAAEQQGYRDGHFVVRDGLRLHYRDYSGSRDKPPLLCLPGLTRNARDFAAFAEGHARSSASSPSTSVAAAKANMIPFRRATSRSTYAGDVIELLDQLSIRTAVFVGTSFGGLVTMTVAAISPDRIFGGDPQ